MSILIIELAERPNGFKSKSFGVKLSCESLTKLQVFIGYSLSKESFTSSIITAQFDKNQENLLRKLNTYLKHAHLHQATVPIIYVRPH